MFDFRREGIDSASKLAIAIHTANLCGDDERTLRLSGNISLRAGLPSITSDVLIEGNGFRIDANHACRLLHISGGNVRINRLSLVNGREQSGGAIFLEGGSLEVSNCTLINNVSDWGGAIHSKKGHLTIFQSTLNENLAEWAGAIYSRDGQLIVDKCDLVANSAEELNGGAIYCSSKLRITGSHFSANVARNLGGAVVLLVPHYSNYQNEISDTIFNRNSAAAGGAIKNFGKLSVSACSFGGNSARRGGAIYHTNRKMIVHNCTIFRNTADEGGGLAVTWDSTATLTHVTIADNSAERGGGIFKRRDGIVNLRNCLLAENTGGDCVGRISQNVGNLIQDDTRSAAINSAPKLGKLIEPDDGSPAYYPPLPSSPAIGAADPAFSIDRDQIGTKRPQGDAGDIGAIEFVSDD